MFVQSALAKGKSPELVVDLQVGLSQFERELGRGTKGRVLAFSRVRRASALFEEGDKEDIEEEAKLLHKMQHLNIISGWFDLPVTLIEGQYPAALLAVEPLGETLDAFMQRHQSR